MCRLRFENAEGAAEFVARAQARKVSSGHSRVLYVDYDYGQRPNCCISLQLPRNQDGSFAPTTDLDLLILSAAFSNVSSSLGIPKLPYMQFMTFDHHSKSLICTRYNSDGLRDAVGPPVY